MYYAKCELNPSEAKPSFILGGTPSVPILVDINFSVFYSFL